MSPASKSKSKSKEKAAKGAKENQKSSLKASGSANNGNGSMASAYDPLSGTFHTLEAAAVVSSLSPHSSGRFRNIDGTIEHPAGFLGTATEYDSVSNNGSCSNESEDQKERTSNATLRQEPIPGSDNDKREKIRQKNEKKHQRQREKRAQELHGKCCNYLMSRKLEMLSQQLVAMGFSPERVTMALMLNEGRVEDSVSWLVESEKNTENIDIDIGSGGNLRLDISEELAQITAMEVKYKCSKQEVERAVVACQGDLEKAEETLKEQKQEALADPPKLDESIVSKNLIKPQEKPTASVLDQERKIERDFNYTKVPAKPLTNSNFSKVPSTVITPPEPGNRNLLLLKTNQAKLTVDKRWSNTGSSPASYPLASPLQATLPSTKVDTRQRAMVSDCKNIQQFQQGAMREPVIMLQRPNSINAKQNLVPNATALPAGTSGWYPNNVPVVETMRPNGKVLLNQGTGNLSSEPFYHQNYLYKNDSYIASSPLDSQAALLGGLRGTVGVPPSPSLSVPSSVGLFSGWGSSSSVGWDTGGLMPQCDYTSIDWTLESSNSLPSKFSGLGLGITTSFEDGSGMTPVRGNGVHYVGLQDGGLAKESQTSAGSHEWTSPFAGNDIFSVPRQVVSSPSP
ncbi:hypothetical protein RJ641_005150 [Dillenia turbinata]|uniref:UBA domain-containing protein n=1 Tax=Dillenia turbinata TaxID=194707 RepID=A0AAN8V7D1_9MAGN